MGVLALIFPMFVAASIITLANSMILSVLAP
jgi:hypothetical protein